MQYFGFFVVWMWFCVVTMQALRLKPPMSPTLTGSSSLHRNALFMADSNKAAPEVHVTKARRKFGPLLARVNYLREKAPVETKLKDDPLLPQVEAIVRAADSRKAGGITVLRVHHLTEITSFMIILEGNSKPQTQAIALSIEDDMLALFNEVPTSKEGTATSGWTLLDYGSIIVHIMTPAVRSYYKLERRWNDAEPLDVAYLLGDARRQKDLSKPDEEPDYFRDTEDYHDEEEEEEVEQDENDPFWS